MKEEQEEEEEEEEEEEREEEGNGNKKTPKKERMKRGKMKTTVWLISHLSWHDRSVRLDQLDKRWKVKPTLLPHHLVNTIHKT